MYSIWRHGFPHGGGPVAPSFRRPESRGCPMLPKDSLPFIREYSWRIMTPFCCERLMIHLCWRWSMNLLYVVLCTVVPGVPIHCWVILQLSAEASRLIWRTRSAVCAGGFGQLRCGCCRPSLDQNREPISASASVFSAFCLSILRFRLWDCKHPSVTSSMLDPWWIFHVNSSKPRSIEALHVMFFPHHSNFVKICQTSRHTEMGC